MSEEETITFNLELNTEQCLSNIRQLEGLLFRTIGLIRRLGLPENINDAIYRLQRLIMIIRLAHSTIIAFELATGPIGWAKAVVGMGVAAAAVGDLYYDGMRGV